MAPKLVVHFEEDTDKVWAHLNLQQEGMPGFKLFLSYIAEFIQIVENTDNTERVCLWQTYFICNTKTSCTLSILTNDKPLLQLDVGQKDKLLAHLKAAYSVWI